MEGSLVIQEERGTINKFRTWYKEKVIDTGKSQKVEKLYDDVINIVNSVDNTITNAASTIIGIIYPEVSSITQYVPALTKFKTKCLDFGKKAIINSKRFIEAKFIGVNGENKEVILPSFNTEQLGNDIKESIRDVTTVVETIEESEQIGKSL